MLPVVLCILYPQGVCAACGYLQIKTASKGSMGIVAICTDARFFKPHRCLSISCLYAHGYRPVACRYSTVFILKVA